MKLRSILKFSVLMSFATLSLVEAHAQDWRGSKSESNFSLGGMMGVGIVDSTSGFTVIGTGSGKIVKDGLLHDVSDSLSLEGQFGPIFLTGVTGWFYSAHLRWDFEKDSQWGFYALGGVGGNVFNMPIGLGITNTRFEFFPRFGVGAVWKPNPRIHVRGEISHEFIGVGLLFPM